MPQFLSLADADTARDLLTFAGRAARVGADGVRLVARDGIVTMQTATLSSAGLLDATPTVIAMRILRADRDLICDFVVDPTLLVAGREPHEVALPDSAISPAWAGIAPPAQGWEWLGEVTVRTMRTIAFDGITAVAELVPTDSGEEIVRSVRASVWGRLSDDLLGAPKGVAFTADALGFLTGEETVSVFTNERWIRFSTQRGHVLSRGPARVGLSTVRATGILTPESITTR